MQWWHWKWMAYDVERGVPLGRSVLVITFPCTRNWQSWAFGNIHVIAVDKWISVHARRKFPNNLHVNVLSLAPGQGRWFAWWNIAPLLEDLDFHFVLTMLGLNHSGLKSAGRLTVEIFQQFACLMGHWLNLENGNTLNIEPDWHVTLCKLKCGLAAFTSNRGRTSFPAQGWRRKN